MEAVQELDVLTIVLLGTVTILLLVGLLVLFILLYQRRVLLERQRHIDAEMAVQSRMIELQLESQEQERKRISADLHDSMGSLLWAAKLSSTYIQRTVPMDGEALVAHRELSGILDECVSLARRIAWELTPEAFQYTGLSDSIASLCERLNGKGCEVRFTTNASVTWSSNRALQVFRMSQELISNALKHSGATIVEVELTFADGVVNLAVRDNGSGFVQSKDVKGVGLWNIHQRLNAISGEIQIGLPPSGTGTQVSIKVPLEPLISEPSSND